MKYFGKQEQVSVKGYFDLGNEGVVVADERAHALKQRPYVERGRFAAVRHICLRESVLLQFECERLHVAANDFNSCSEN